MSYDFIQTAHAVESASPQEGNASEHTGPHIPTLQGEVISGSSDLLGGIPVTTTILSTWIYMILLFVGVAFFYRAARGGAMPRLKAVGIDLMSRLDVFFGELL